MAMSFGLVCLILLSSGYLLALIGMCKKQNQVILVTGIMFLLAGE